MKSPITIATLLAMAAMTMMMIITNVSSAFAQGSNELVGGRYVDGAAGFQIDFPDGWKGPNAYSYPIVSPESFAGWPPATMTVVTVDAQSAKAAWQKPDFKLSAIDACKEITRNYVTVNKMRASEVIKVCENESFARTKSYSFASKDGIIIVTFNANSTASYDKYIAAFEKSVSSIRVFKPADIRTLVRDLSGQHSALYKVVAQPAAAGNGGGKATNAVDVRVDATSLVSNLQLTPAATADGKRAVLSFDVEGKKGTRGVTEISIGSLLKGPYEVRIDGALTKEVKKTEDRTTGETLLSINYSHDAKHRITITTAAAAKK
ncbi:hypothetical protein [Nitrososphaera sp.]|uniref:hypothetical protein n=1 Tax=Nitrososphaera sp. TaxID=1971748 RepID=UPI00307F2136